VMEAVVGLPPSVAGVAMMPNAVNRIALSFAACRPQASVRDRAARPGVRPLVCWPALPLASSLPSPTSAVAAWAGVFCIAQGALVRSLLQSWGTVRRPASVRHGRVRAVPRAGLAALDPVSHRDSRVPHTRFPCLPGVCDPARGGSALPWRRTRCGLLRVRSASAPRWAVSGLHTLPARSPVNASWTPFPKLAHDAGPAWVAKPSLSETGTLSHRAGLPRHTRTLRLSRAQWPEQGTSGATVLVVKGAWYIF
jgi:hypothetical protein